MHEGYLSRWNAIQNKQQQMHSNLTCKGTNMKLPYWKPLKLLFDSPTTHMA